MSRPLIRALALDLGEVLIRLDFSRVMELRGLGNPNLASSLDHMNQWDIYDAFERGKLTESAFISEASKRLGLKLSDSEFLAHWNSVLRETVPGVPELLKSLSETLPVYALTNSNETHIRHAKKHYPWLTYFRHVYTSFELQARKPERLIYDRLSEAIQVKPESILFIDDRLENVEGAKDAGFNAHCCASSPKDLFHILDSYGLGGAGS